MVWSSSITEEETANLERVQKIALRIILKETYESYENALNVSELQTLKERREILSIKFAKNCVKNNKTSPMFPLNPSQCNIETRDRERYLVQKCKTVRLYNSAIPYMQRLLNKNVWLQLINSVKVKFKP